MQRDIFIFKQFKSVIKSDRTTSIFVRALNLSRYAQGNFELRVVALLSLVCCPEPCGLNAAKPTRIKYNNPNEHLKVISLNKHHCWIFILISLYPLLFIFVSG